MNKFYDESFVDDIKRRIVIGEFTSKEALAQYLEKIPEIIANNDEMLRHLESSRIDYNKEDLNAITITLLDYYDKTHVYTASLNLDNITSFKVDDKEYMTEENSAEQFFNQMDHFELEYILNNKFDSLTEEQKLTLNKIIEKRRLMFQQQNFENQNQQSLDIKQKVKVLTMKDVNKKYNGFTSIVFIFLLTSLYGVGFILYILFSNGALK